MLAAGADNTNAHRLNMAARLERDNYIIISMGTNNEKKNKNNSDLK